MAELKQIICLVEVLCARMCHDLGGLIGTVSNAVDMVEEDAGGSNEVVAFAASASKALIERFQLMRAAWGPELEALPWPQFARLVTAPLAARRIDIDAGGFRPNGGFPAAVGRVVLNLILLACECLPRGGTIELMGEPEDLLIRINGPGAEWPAGFTACLRDQDAAIASLGSARSIQMPLTVLFALSRNLRLSPLLGQNSGVEAIRLNAV